MILHFVRPLVTSLRIRIPSHAFNLSKHATVLQWFDALGPKFTRNVCTFCRSENGQRKIIRGTDVGHGKFKLHSSRTNSMRMHVCTRMFGKV